MGSIKLLGMRLIADLFERKRWPFYVSNLSNKTFRVWTGVEG